MVMVGGSVVCLGCVDHLQECAKPVVLVVNVTYWFSNKSWAEAGTKQLDHIIKDQVTF